jgi:hypothetical protein
MSFENCQVLWKYWQVWWRKMMITMRITITEHLFWIIFLGIARDSPIWDGVCWILWRLYIDTAKPHRNSALLARQQERPTVFFRWRTCYLGVWSHGLSPHCRSCPPDCQVFILVQSQCKRLTLTLHSNREAEFQSWAHTGRLSVARRIDFRQSCSWGILSTNHLH